MTVAGYKALSALTATMFEKSDQKFLKSLDSSEEFEEMLDKLAKARRRCAFYAIGGIVLFFAGFYLSLTIAQRSSGIAQTLILFLPFGFLLSPLMISIRGFSIHAQIRTSLAFGKIRDSKTNTTF